MEKTLNTKSKSNLIAGGFLLIVILLTIVLGFYNSSLENKASLLDEKINTLETNISEIKKDKNLSRFILYKKHKALLDSMAKNSEINKIGNNLKEIQDKYGILIKPGVFNDGVVSTTIFAITGESVAYEKMANFLKEYRLEEGKMFDLDFVNNIYGGSDKLKIQAKFIIK